MNLQLYHQYIPSKYIPIRLAGNGIFGKVYICLPRDIAMSAKANASLRMADLRNKTIAVKVADGGKHLHNNHTPARRVLAKEVSTMQKIQAARCSDLMDQLPTILQHGPLLISPSSKEPPECDWLAMEVFHSPVTFLNFRRNFTFDAYTAPDELGAHIFLQLYPALQFLHKNLGIAHGDVHFGNILVDTKRETKHGFPGLVLIDYGSSLDDPPDEVETLKREDIKGLCCAIIEATEYNSKHVTDIQDTTQGEPIDRELRWEESGGDSVNDETDTTPGKTSDKSPEWDDLTGYCISDRKETIPGKTTARSPEWKKFLELIDDRGYGEDLKIDMEEVWSRYERHATELLEQVTPDTVQYIRNLVEKTAQKSKGRVTDEVLQTAINSL
ncbi:hypothetical protein K504DRAFT_451949 [Pleomassaria siparia CBS 279.74]|uniref:Protein kinase domain-containing protein n=1 Tax=Pleomassaria siparia CBS 279.74 TaxID=1314801 RepID=A0A6G1JQR4_9PLEO|nr:hypothetical protein K504DRAFT_451949 [Pleomassaria siparia CBS 279.74]